MAIETFNVRTALESANARLVLLITDVRLDAAEQALCSELEQANTLAIGALNGQDIIPNAGQRLARAVQIEDKANALQTVSRVHQSEIGVDATYNALDLSLDAAGAIRIQSPTFTSDISTGS